MYTLSHSDSDHIDFKTSAVTVTEQKPPKGNNTSASDLEQVGVWCSEVCDPPDTEPHTKEETLTPEMFSTIFSPLTQLLYKKYLLTQFGALHP